MNIWGTVLGVPTLRIIVLWGSPYLWKLPQNIGVWGWGFDNGRLLEIKASGLRSRLCNGV